MCTASIAIACTPRCSPCTARSCCPLFCRYEIPTQLSYENRLAAGWAMHDQIYVAYKLARA